MLPSREQFIEFVQAIRSAGGRDSKNCADFVQFVAFTGCRLSEAIAVIWHDIDFNKSEITVRGDAITGTKNSEARRVPMIPELRVLLQRVHRLLGVGAAHVAVAREIQAGPFFVPYGGWLNLI
jgi:integrase